MKKQAPSTCTSSTSFSHQEQSVFRCAWKRQVQDTGLTLSPLRCCVAPLSLALNMLQCTSEIQESSRLLLVSAWRFHWQVTLFLVTSPCASAQRTSAVSANERTEGFIRQRQDRDKRISMDLKARLSEMECCWQWKQQEMEVQWVGKVNGFTPVETGVDFWYLDF